MSLSVRIGMAAGGKEAFTYTDHNVKGRILDLSPTGCAIFTRESLSNGTDVGLVIHLDQGGDIAARGHVRWTKGVDAREGFASGIEFDNLGQPSRDLIARFLRHLDENIGM